MASQKNVKKVFHLLLTGMWLVPPKPGRQVPVCRSESRPRAWQEGRGGTEGGLSTARRLPIFGYESDTTTGKNR